MGKERNLLSSFRLKFRKNKGTLRDMLKGQVYDDKNNNYGSITNKAVRRCSIFSNEVALEEIKKFCRLVYKIRRKRAQCQIHYCPSWRLGQAIVKEDKVLACAHGFTDEELDFIPSAFAQDRHQLRH